MTQFFSNQSFIRLKLVGFKEIDSEMFLSILSIAESRLEIPWRVVDSVDADYFLLSNRLRNQMDQNALLHTLPRERCIFCTYETTDSDDNELIIAGDNIPSLNSLILLFNRLIKKEMTPVASINDTNSLDQPPSTIDPSPPLSPESDSSPDITQELAVDSNFFDPEQGLLGLLISNQKTIKSFDLNNTKGTSKLYINTANKTFYCKEKLELLDGLFSSFESLISASLSEGELEQVIAVNGLKQQPLDNLIWHICFRSSQGKIIKGYNQNDIVHLKRWPDITLPECRKLIKLAAYMQSNAADLNTAQQKTGFSIEKINSFYNACKMIGLIEHSDQTDLHEKSLNEENRQLFAKIDKRLNQTH